jgi:hypothetical protein
VPAGGSVVAGPIPWDTRNNNRPASGHGCFVAVLDQPEDPAPPLIDVVRVTDFWKQFLGYVGNNNNVAWRNFNVVEIAAQDAAIEPLGAGAWFMSGAPDTARAYRIVLDLHVPRDAVVWLEIPVALTGLVEACPFRLVSRRSRTQERVAYQLAARHRIELGPVRIGAGVRHQCRFQIESPTGFPAGAYRVAVRQFDGQIEVGRITWIIRARPA